MASHEPGGLELPDAQGDGRRLVAARGGKLCLGTRSRHFELEEQELVAGMDAERGKRGDGELSVAEPDGADRLVECVGLVEIHPGTSSAS